MSSNRALNSLEGRLKEIRERKEIGPVTRIYWGYHYKVNLKFAIQNTQKGDRILDVGCGTSDYIITLSKIGRICYGIDPLLEISLLRAREKANKEKVNVNLIQGVGENLPFEKNFFSMVLCFSTLQHVKDQNKVLSEIKRVLNNSGLFLMSIPLDKNIFNLFKRTKKPIYVTKSFSLKDLRVILKANDFEILKIRGCGFFPPFTNRFLFVLYRFLGEKPVRKIIEVLDIFAKLIPSSAASVVILSKIKK